MDAGFALILSLFEMLVNTLNYKEFHIDEVN
jgi:hypothetical protein